MKKKIRTKVDINYFKEQAIIKEQLKVGDPNSRYIYRIEHRNKIYILKGLKIRIEHLDPEDDVPNLLRRICCKLVRCSKSITSRK